MMIDDWKTRHGAPTGRATKLKPWRVWVRLPLVPLLRAAGIAFGRAVGRRAACKAAALTGNVGSIPTRGTVRMRNGEFGIEVGVFSPHSAIRSPH